MKIDDKVLIKTKAFINGEWVESDNKETFPVINPATGEVIAEVASCGSEETNRAIESAEKARKDWSATSAKERANLLRTWFELMMEAQEDLAQLLTAEQGKPLFEARGEIAYGANFIEWFAEEGKRIYGDLIPPPSHDKRIVVTKQPVGVVACITPWNFPNAMLTRKIAPALAAGCTVVCKPANATPLSALAICELAARAGIPDGVINIVAGRTSEIGEALTTSPLVRKLTFTGSTPIGKKLMADCSKTMKRTSMELGGNAPFIVFDDADLDAAVEGAMICKFRTAGQTCVCANRFLLQEKIYDEFLEKFVAEVAKIKVGNGLESSTSSGPLIDQFSLEKVQDHVNDAVNTGAKIAIGGDIHSLGGNFYIPTVLSNVTTKAKITYEETFGPVAPIYKFSSDEDVINLANDTPFGLASYFFARDIGRIWKVAEALEYGIVSVNTGLPTKAEIPFGVVKESGLGREGSRYGLDDYLEIKYISKAGI